MSTDGENLSGETSQATLLGHPTGLFALFFSEMWERFSYYGMRALLLYYMMKGFLAYSDRDAYRVYGAYTALVYMTPFLGGILADRYLGARRAAVFGGIMMALGHLTMVIEPSFLTTVFQLAGVVVSHAVTTQISNTAFFLALAMLIVGNGFFKPNISTMVGGLYDGDASRRDSGFTLFYMGINLGAAMSPILCGYLGQTYGWHYGFGVATLGMLVGLAVFVVPAGVARWMILLSALGTAFAMMAVQIDLNPDSSFIPAVFEGILTAMQTKGLLVLTVLIVAVALVLSGFASFVALGRGGLPDHAGAPKDRDAQRAMTPIILGGAVLSVPVFATLVWSNRLLSIIPESFLATLQKSDSTIVRVAGTFAGEIATPTGLILTTMGTIAISYLVFVASKSTIIERQRLAVVGVLMFFSLLFWAFFEQAGTSVSNFTDRNVDRVMEASTVAATDVGSTMSVVMSQEQVGFPGPNGAIFTMDQLDALSAAERSVNLTITQAHIGMGINGESIVASMFQSANPIFILIFGLVFSIIWRTLAAKKMEPSTPVKFSMGLFQLGLGFLVLYASSISGDERGMVGMTWLLMAYLLHTTGELCLSPVGLSMVTKLSPKRVVSTVMGAWFLATSFSSFLAAVLATFTGVDSEGGSGAIPLPTQTIHVYGNVFFQMGVVAIVSAAILLILSPKLTKWMHLDKP